MSDAATATKAATEFFRPRRLGHANIFIRDYVGSQLFYAEVAGFEPAYIQPDNKSSFVSNGNTYHDLALVDLESHYNTTNGPPGLNHIAFELENEVDLVAGYRRARDAGIEFYAADHDVAHSLYTNDPDGNGVELYADVIKDWRSNRHGVIIKEKPKYVPGISSPPSAEHNYPQDPQLRVLRDAMFHPKKVSHVGFVTANFAAMYDYYVGLIGLSPLCGDREARFAVLKGTYGNGDVTLLRRGPGLEPGLHHVGCEVWDEADLARSRAAAQAAGLVERHVDHPARVATTIRDPSGIRLQFYVNRQWRPDVIAGIAEADAPYLL